MAGRNRALSEYVIIADLMRAAKRHGSALDVQLPVPRKDTFTVASTPATTYTLSALPISPSINLSLNGLELLEGADYTVNYTTAVVTVSATLKGTPPPADVLTADYWTTGDLVAGSGTPDSGGFSDNFNRADSATTLGSPWVTWAAAASPNNTSVWGISANQAYLTAQVIVSSVLYVAIAYQETGTSDGTLSVDIPTAPSTERVLLAFRLDPASGKFHYVTSQNLYYWDGISATFITGFGTTVVSGDHLDVVLSGSSITVKLTHLGTTTTVASTSSATQTQTNTKHGLGGGDVAVRYDNIAWVPA